MGLTRIAITRPVFMLMLMLAAILLGFMSYNGMRVEQNPEVQFGVISVTTVYPGAGPEEVNTLISRKVEEAMAGVNGIREVTSTSQEGISIVVANFNIGTDMDVALNDARGKVDLIVGELPLGIEKPTISKADSASSPVLYMALSSDTHNARELRDIAENQIKDRFAQVPGVASVSVQGGEERELQVRLKKDALLAYGIGIAQVQRAVQSATLNVPSGRVVAGPKEYAVRVLGEFKSVDDLKNTIITVSDPNNPMAKGKIVRLSEVAEVVDASAERTSYTRLNGEDAVVVAIQKTRDGNAVEIAEGLFGGVSPPKVDPAVIADKVSKRIPLTLFEDIKYKYDVNIQVTLNTAILIEESIADLNFSLFFGIFLVALIVYIFLHNFRGMLIVAIAIPLCIFATFIAMKLFGFTINNLSMLALSLAVGVLVDDAIVVLENIYRHLQMGEDPREAALNGRAEIGLAAIAITLADVVVFLPIGNMGGIVGQFFRPLGIGFAVAVLISLFVSFTITPMLAARWYRKGENVEHFDKGFAGWFERQFSKLADLYRRGLDWSLNHRWFVFIAGNLALVAIVMVIAGSFAGPSVGFPLFGVAFVVGILVFVINGLRGFWKPQFILYGALFGLAFPASAFLGHQWAAWKGEAVFKGGFFPPSDGGLVTISVELPPGSALSETQRVVDRLEAICKEHPDTKYVLSTVGSSGGGQGGFTTASAGGNRASISVTLDDKYSPIDRKGTRRASDQDIAAQLTEQIGQVAGARVIVSAAAGVGFGPPIQMSFTGDDRDQLVRTVDNIRLKLQNGAVPGVINPDISSKPGKPELRAIPDREKLADSGLTVADLANTMRILYEGNRDTKFRVQGQEYDIRVMMDVDDRNNPAILNQVPIAFNQGNPVYVPQVASIQEGIGVDKIERRDRVEEVRLTAELLPGQANTNAQAAIDKYIEDNNLVPQGVQQKKLGQADFQAREGIYLMTALGLGFILVYMLLASLFNNLLYPLIIQLAQPQAMVGALLALMITDKTLNIVGFIGLITLVGLVGKNAILLVDFTNTLRERGHNRHDAILEAGPTRLRPIMMTTLALILGILPVALALGRGSEFRETIGISIIGGITLSTLLTLFVIPCSYTIFDDFSDKISGRRRSRGSSEAPPVIKESDRAA